MRPLLARAAALVAVARFEIDEYSSELRIPPSRFVLIPNGVDLPEPVDRGDTMTVASAGPLIASVGRLERYKGHQRVIAAMPAVRRVLPDARPWIAGTGPYEAQLRRIAEELGVADAVEISSVPADDRGAMAGRLAKADLVVLLSDFEDASARGARGRPAGPPASGCVGLRARRARRPRPRSFDRA